MTPGIREFARAKVNLTLHITGKRDDGYHLLDSLVVFPEIGDVLELSSADETSLVASGPFASLLGPEPDNLVLRAVRCFGPGTGVRIALTKALPVASGIGGGSADAAATLRGLSQLWGERVSPETALTLGADVPVCLTSTSARMAGIGDVLSPVANLPDFWMVLVNNGQSVATGLVFAAQRTTRNPPMGPVPAFNDFETFVDWLAEQRNDLQSAALTVEPGIGAPLQALEAAPECRLARMSGSGGTCFGIFACQSDAERAAAIIGDARPDWWVACGPVLARSGHAGDDEVA